MDSARPYVKPPPFMNRLVNPVVVRLGLTTTLLVKGRRTGTTLRVPLGRPMELDGARYLVAGRGNTHWVRNLRAAGGGYLRERGRTLRFAAREVTGDEQLRVVAAYRERLGRSVDRYFAEIPEPRDHPVFRIEPLDARVDVPVVTG